MPGRSVGCFRLVSRALGLEIGQSIIETARDLGNAPQLTDPQISAAHHPRVNAAAVYPVAVAS